MTSPNVRPVLLALLCILAIALAAATLNSAVDVDGEFGFGGSAGVDNGSAGPTLPNTSSPAANTTPSSGILDLPSLCVPIIASPQFQVGVVLLGLVAVSLLYRWKGPYLPFLLAVGIAPFALILYVVLTSCVDRGNGDETSVPPEAINTSEGLPSTVGEGMSGGASGTLSAPSLLLLGVLAAALIGVVALYIATSDDREIEVQEEEEATTEPAPEVIGRIAGQAADRIEEDAALENEVFRAWHEMTTYLDVANPESSSPGEFADAAVAAGMDRDDVTRLTRLFEEIRYGTAEPTSERERRAIDALRRIEEAYSEDAP